MNRDLLDRIRQLEEESRPLEPGAEERRRLRDAVVACSERFLESLDTLGAYAETADPGIGLLDEPISDRGVPVERVIELLEREVIRHAAYGGFFLGRTRRSSTPSAGTAGSSSPRPCSTAASPCGWRSWPSAPTAGRSTWPSTSSASSPPESVHDTRRLHLFYEQGSLLWGRSTQNF